MFASIAAASLVYNQTMTGLTIYVDWQYFLGIIGALIGLAYYANGRFTKIETSMEWLKETVLSIKICSENRTNKVFDADSPIALTTAGRIALYGSGLKAYIDKHKRNLLMHCDNSRRTDPYEFQAYAFRMFMALQL